MLHPEIKLKQPVRLPWGQHGPYLILCCSARAPQGSALWARFSASWGYLNKQGYCDGGNTLGSPSGSCHLFPVLLGETGTGFTVRLFRPTRVS